MLTARGKYGLKAMVHLASLEAGTTARAITIAKHHNIPKKFLDAILGDLRKAGLVSSKKGPGGGYALARRSREIQVGMVIRALETARSESRNWTTKVEYFTSHNSKSMQASK